LGGFQLENARCQGIFITAIDRTQVTVRDDPHNAYYEIPVNDHAQ